MPLRAREGLEPQPLRQGKQRCIFDTARKWKDQTGRTTTRGADEGTRTHTLTHENLNLACLPIPSHLQMVAYFGLEPTSSDYKSDALTN